MLIPGLSALKTWGLFIVSIFATVMFALFKSQQALRYKEKAKVAHTAAKVAVESQKAIAKADRRVNSKLKKKDPERKHFE